MSQPSPQVATIPRPPGPPFEPTSLLLDHATGWRFAEDTGLFETSRCELVLQEAPGSTRQLTEASGSFGGLAPPGNVACAPDGAIYLLDETRHVLKRFDPCACAFVAVGCLTRRGGGARELRGRGGIAIGGGALYVCDGGLDGRTRVGSNPHWNILRERLRAENHRVSVFDLDGFGLRGHLRPPASEFARWKPTAVAVDRRSGVWVTDGANNCVQNFSLAGRWRKAVVGFNAPTEIACDRLGDLFVLDIDPATNQPRAQFLHVDGRFGTLPASVAAAARAFARLPFHVLANGTLDMRECCINLCGTGWFAPDGTPLAQAPTVPPRRYLASGVYRTTALDSGILACQWHRVALCGALPAGTWMKVETFAADQVYTDDQLAGFAVWSTVQARPRPPAPVKSNKSAAAPWHWDALVRSPPGRYLWLRITLCGSGVQTPALRSAVVEFPRITSMQYLPAVFGAEATSADFSQRFVALYDHVMRSIECKVDTLACWFDPLSTPGRSVGGAPIDFLTWLASWIGLSLDRSWSEAKRRWLVKNAARLYPLRGTLKGLRGMLLLLLGWDQPPVRWSRPATRPTCAPRADNCRPLSPCVTYEPPPLILEHFRLRRWLRLGAGRLGEEATLWGQRIVDRSQLDVNARVGETLVLTTPTPADDPVLVHANRFTVFVPARLRAPAPRRSLENLLRSESAAYLAYDIEYVEPRMRIGVQSMIGFDSVIGRVPEGVVLGANALGRATVLTAAPGAEPGARLGRTSRLGSGDAPMH